MEEWEQQIYELKSSLRSKDNTIIRLRKYLDVFKKEFARRESEYQHEISTLRTHVQKLKREKKLTKRRVKEFVKTKKKEMKEMKHQLELLEQQQLEKQQQMEQQKELFKEKMESLEQSTRHIVKHQNQQQLQHQQRPDKTISTNQVELTRSHPLDDIDDESSDDGLEDLTSEIPINNAPPVVQQREYHSPKRSNTGRHSIDTVPVRQNFFQQQQQQQSRPFEQPAASTHRSLYDYPSSPSLKLPVQKPLLTQQEQPHLSSRSTVYLKELEKEYLSQIDKYKELLHYENDRLSGTKKEFVDYVHEKTKEIESLQDQVRHLKDFILSTNSELNQMATSSSSGFKPPEHYLNQYL